ncbi:Sec14p-like phosphatidylinositol transfer family protein [Zea mays]|jgi:hypothetical protein|uniref:Sec14p-like phosphatidylinositol transfer family protein n=1 Tax=Zea mays TaxID=4577 RepID=A0A1D6QR72_MAIZE|nr:Sec14p-like phosphatidylinositol transfer family protein [Zea mays]AQK60006.1 Sec14p-like phosphatidylinositol transfer family protein [Zea mays]
MFLICVSFTIAIAGTTKLPTETTLVHSILVALLHSLYYPPVHVYRVIKFLKMFDCYLHFSVVRCKYVIHDYLFINLNYNLLRDSGKQCEHIFVYFRICTRAILKKHWCVSLRLESGM